MLYPVVVAVCELLLDGGRVSIQPWYLTLMVWGYLQYRLIGRYRIRRGGGGPGMDTPPERLVTSGPFAWSRNPMYLGHIIFLIGLALTFQSLPGAAIAAGTAIWFQFRVRRDERRLLERFGKPYEEYRARVGRWLPGLWW